jgi:hypothetical protein
MYSSNLMLSQLVFGYVVDPGAVTASDIKVGATTPSILI